MRVWHLNLKQKPDFHLVSHLRFFWGPLPEAEKLNWIPADFPILKALEKHLNTQNPTLIQRGGSKLARNHS